MVVEAICDTKAGKLRIISSYARKNKKRTNELVLKLCACRISGRAPPVYVRNVPRIIIIYHKNRKMSIIFQKVLIIFEELAKKKNFPFVFYINYPIVLQ